MNRRELLKGLMAGGTIIAGELWVPGQTFISIPSGKQFYGSSLFELVGDNLRYIGPENKTVTVNEFYNWLRRQANNLVMEGGKSNEHRVALSSGYRIENPEHLVEGTLEQDRERGRGYTLDCKENGRSHGDREYWSSTFDLSDDELLTDKIYQPDYYSTPADRRGENDLGEKGWK